MRSIKEMQGDLPLDLFLLYCSSDLRFWSENVMGKIIQPFHVNWLNLIKNNKRVAIQAFTGSGKTETLAICYPLWYLFHNPNREILIVSTTLRQSISVLERIKSTIMDNELLMSMVDKKHLISGNWCSRSNNGAHIILTNGRKIFCAPSNENIRGYHVDQVIADEVSAYRDPNVYKSYISTRVGAKSKDGRIVAISTSKSPTDLLQELINNSEYVSDTVPIMYEDGTYAWPERYGAEFVESRRNELGNGNFEREYLCNPKAEVEGAIFTAEDMMACADVTLSYSSDTFGGDCFIGADFAVSNSSRADYDVYWVLEKKGGKMILRDVFRERGVPKDEKVTIIKELFERFGCYRVLLDVSGIGKAVSEDLSKLGIPADEISFKPSNRRELLVNMISVVQGRKLVIPYNPKDPKFETSKTLLDECIGFREDKNQNTGMLMYKSTTPHDDCVMALALACKGALELEEYNIDEWGTAGV